MEEMSQDTGWGRDFLDVTKTNKQTKAKTETSSSKKIPTNYKSDG